MDKKIVIGTDVMTRGGVDTYTIDLVKMALKQNWQAEVVVDTLTTSSIPQVLADLCPVHKGPLYHRQHEPSTIETFYSHFLKEKQPHLVHLICGIPWGCLRMREIVLENKIPLVFTEQYVPSNLSLEPNVLDRLQKIHRQTQGVIYVSDENQKTLSSLFPTSLPFPSRVISNGIDWKTIQKNAPPFTARAEQYKNRCLRGEKIRLLAMARLTKQKGIDLLIEAIRNLPEEDRKKVRLDIWGEGPELIELQKKVISLDLHSVIEFYPWIEESLHLFSFYDLFIFPSRYEGLPFTLLEALASDIPIIASNIPPHQWITQSGKHALLFESENSQALTKALQEWFSHPFEQRAENRFLWLEEHFDREKNINRTLGIWEELIHG